MFLIKSCPRCERKLRFPLDKGKIKVRCKCGYSFIADPDNPSLYKNAEFDLSYSSKKKPLSLLRLFRQLQSVRLKDAYSAFINRYLKVRYTLQNFKLLASSEQQRIVLFMILIGVIAVAIFILIYFLLYTGPPGAGIVI